MKDIVAIVAVVIATLTVVPYLIDIVKKRTKPNIVSWFTWMLLTGVATAAAFTAGETNTALLTLGSTICSGSVVVLGVKYGVAKFSYFDVLCQIGVIVGLILWLMLDSPLVAIVAAVSIDFIAVMPTLRHSWIKPAEETWQTFMGGSVAAFLTIFSLHELSVVSLLYPAFLFIINGLIAATVVLRRKKLGISLSR